MDTMRLPIAALTVASILGLSLVQDARVHAQDKPATTGTGTGTKPDDLTPEEKKERELRKDCKVKICAAFRNMKPMAAISPAMC